MGLFRQKNNAEKVKITVVDDEKDLVQVIKDFLEARNFAVSVAYNGRTGLEVIKKEKPDLVILDITMPDLDGRDILIELKKDEDTKNIPVILLTAKSEQFDREYGLKLGAHEYIVKPYQSHVLLRHIQTILEKKEKGII